MSSCGEDDNLSIISATTLNSVYTVPVFPFIQTDKERLPRGLMVQTGFQVSEQDGSSSPILPSLHKEIIKVPLSTKATRNNENDGLINNDDVDDDCSEMSEVLIPLKQKTNTETQHSTTVIGGEFTGQSRKQPNQEETCVEMSQSLLPSADLTEDYVTAKQYNSRYQPSEDIMSSHRDLIGNHIPVEGTITFLSTEQNKGAASTTSDCINHVNTQEELKTKTAEEVDSTFITGKTLDHIELESSLKPEGVAKPSQKRSTSKQQRKSWRSESEMLKENTADFFKWNTSNKQNQNVYENEPSSYKTVKNRSQRSTRGNVFTDSQRSFVSPSTPAEKGSNPIFYPSSQPSRTVQRSSLPKTDLNADKLNIRIGKLLTSIDAASEREQEVIKTTVEHCMMKLQDNLDKKLTDFKFHPYLLDCDQVKNLLRIIQSNLTQIMKLYKKLESQYKQPDQPSLIGMHVQHKKNLLSIVQRQQQLVKQFKNLEGDKTIKLGSSSLSSKHSQTSNDKSKNNPVGWSQSQIRPTTMSEFGKQDVVDSTNINFSITNKDLRSKSKKELKNLHEKNESEKHMVRRKAPVEKATKRNAEDDDVVLSKKKRPEKDIEVLTQKTNIYFSDQDAVSDSSQTLINEDVTKNDYSTKTEPDEVREKVHSASKGEASKETKETNTHSEMLWLNMLHNGEDKDDIQSSNKQGCKTFEEENVDVNGNVARTSVADVEDLIENDLNGLNDNYISESESVDILTATKVNEANKTFDECTEQTQLSLQDEELFSQKKTCKEVAKEDIDKTHIGDSAHTIKDVIPFDGKGPQLDSFENNENNCYGSVNCPNQTNIHIKSKLDNKINLNDCSKLDDISHQEELVSPTSTCISSVFVVKTQELERRQKQRMMEVSDGIVKGHDKDQIPLTSEKNDNRSEKVRGNTGTNNIKECADNGQVFKRRLDQVVAAQKPVDVNDYTKAGSLGKPHAFTMPTRGKLHKGIKVWPVVESNCSTNPQVIISKPQTQQNQSKTVLFVTKASTCDSRTFLNSHGQKGNDGNLTYDALKDSLSLKACDKLSQEIQNTNTMLSWRDLPSWRDLFAEKNILPGKNVLSVNVQDSVHRASLTENGKICDSRGIMFNTPAKWMSSLTSGQTVKKSKAFQQIHYLGKPITGYCKASCQSATHSIHKIHITSVTNHKPSLDHVRGFSVFSMHRQHIFYTDTHRKEYDFVVAVSCINSQANQLGIQGKNLLQPTNTTDQITQTESVDDIQKGKYRLFDEHLNRLLSTSVIKLLKKEDFVSSHDLPANFWTNDYAQVKLSKSVWDSVTMW